VYTSFELAALIDVNAALLTSWRMFWPSNFFSVLSAAMNQTCP
jgi:hypothetical protein